MKLGETTDTQDAEGNIIERNEQIEIDEATIANTLKSFKGEIHQIPPQFSALKHKGKPLYKYAKKGINIPLEPRKVLIHSIELLNIAIPYVCFRVLCSKGTYIRTLCHDIGKRLGTGAHLSELERTAVGPFNAKDSLSIEALKSIAATGTSGKGIYSMDTALSWMPEIKIKETLVNAVKNGSPVKIKDCLDFSENFKNASGIKLKSPEGKLLAIGRFHPDKESIGMDVVLAT